MDRRAHDMHIKWKLSPLERLRQASNLPPDGVEIEEEMKVTTEDFIVSSETTATTVEETTPEIASIPAPFQPPYPELVRSMATGLTPDEKLQLFTEDDEQSQPPTILCGPQFRPCCWMRNPL